MKKLFLFIAVMVLTAGSLQAQEIRFGAKAGVNFASGVGDDADGLDGRTGFNVGAVAKIGIGELFAVQPEIIYSAQGYKQDIDGMEVTGKLDYINIPVLADFTIAEGLSLQGGPQFGINVTDEAEFEGNTSSLEAKSIDFGAALGIEYRLPMGVFIQARYATGLSSSLDDIEVDLGELGTSVIERDVKNSVISVSVGYFFN
jgi:hypothetical protein